jgi:hypothetical protein
MILQRIAVVLVSVTLFVIQNVSAQVLFTTTNDFGQFNSGAGVVSSAYYSDSSAVNGIGNTVNAGGAGTVGSLQLTATGGWSGWMTGSDWPFPTYDLFQAIDPGGARPWNAESGYGPGTLIANSGTITFDLYRGNLPDWNWWGVNFNYNGYWGPFWAATSSDFTGADGRTWTHFEVPYTINATAGITYWGMALTENSSGANAGQTIYVDNIQVVPVPEPGAFALLGLGMLSLFFVLRRRVS